jgi:hypothetical protein
MPRARPIFSIRMRISGQQRYINLVDAYDAACQRVHSRPYRVGSDLPYAGPINIGRFLTGRRAGQIARRAGPVLYLQTAAAVVRPLVGREIADACNRSGPHAMDQAWLNLARKAQTVARATITSAPAVRSGALRNSVGVWLHSTRVA